MANILSFNIEDLSPQEHTQLLKAIENIGIKGKMQQLQMVYPLELMMEYSDGSDRLDIVYYNSNQEREAGLEKAMQFINSSPLTPTPLSKEDLETAGPIHIIKDATEIRTSPMETQNDEDLMKILKEMRTYLLNEE